MNVGFFVLSQSLMGDMMNPKPPPGKTNWFAQLNAKEMEAQRGLYKEGPVADFIKKAEGCTIMHATFMANDILTIEELCEIFLRKIEAPFTDTTNTLL